MSKKCPKCEKVFDDDTLTVCPDCNEALVDVPAEEPKEVKQVSVFSLTNEESAQGVIEFMKEQGVEGTYQYSLREKTYKIFVAQTDARAALKACTSYYAEEAKRLKAEEEKRRKEEEERLRKEEEERLRREAEEAERRRKEEEERIRAEEEARRAAEEAERLAREEAERIAREEEEARRAAEEAERLAREAEERRIYEEQQALIRAAEEAERLAREEEERLKEAERLRLEEEERIRREEAERLAREEEERKKEAAAKRRMLFEQAIQENETKKEEELKNDPNYIPHVNAETVQDDFFSSVFVEDVVPESGPIFVETEPVDEYEVGDTIVVDAVDVEPGDESAETVEEEAVAPSLDDFFANLNKRKMASFLDEPIKVEKEEKVEKVEVPEEPKPVATPEPEKKMSRADFFASLEKEDTKKEPVVEDMFTDNVFRNKETTKQEEKAPLFEEVIDKDLNKSKKTDFKAAFESAGSIDDIDDGGYKGFVPDYHQADDKVDPDEIIAKQYGFSADDYKALKERTAKKAQERKANPVKPKKESKDFKIVDDDLNVGDYQGFIPDYAAKKGLENMTFYTSSTKVDYSKYRTKNTQDRNSLGDLYATLRSASTTELTKLFEADVVNVSASTKDMSDLKNSTYLLALTGGQLNSLLNAWLMTNVSSVTVKQFEDSAALSEDNYNKKIEGIKNLLKQNFGKLDDSILDVIVKTFYNKYLDD